MLGAIGATAGVILAVIISYLANHGGLTWTPPGNATAIPLRLSLLEARGLIVGTWLGLILVSTIAALIPANRAAKLEVVDALRHV